MKTLYKKMQHLDAAGESYEVLLYLEGDTELKGPILTYTDDSIVIDNSRERRQSELHVSYSSIKWAVLITED